MSLKDNSTFRRSLDLLDQIESLSKGYKNVEARMWLKNASKKIQRAIHEEFHVSPEVAMSLKDEILRGN